MRRRILKAFVLLLLNSAFLLSLNVSLRALYHQTLTILTIKSPSVAAELTGDHQGHRVSLIVVTHDNLTVVSA